jgi:outer membrane protein TolC
MSLLLAFPVISQEQVVDSKTQAERGSLFDSAESDVLHLSRLVKTVVNRNALIVRDRLQMDIARHRIDYEGAIFEPVVNLAYRRSEENNPNNTSQVLSRGNLLTFEDESEVHEASVGGAMYYGGDWRLSMSRNSSKNNIIESLREYDTEWESEVRLSLRQPLLRGFGTESTLANLQLAKLDQQTSHNQFRRDVMDLIALTVTEYWRLHGTLKVKQSLEASIQLMEKNLQILNERFLVGEAAELEIMQTRRHLMERQLELEGANHAIHRSQRQIMLLLNTENTLASRMNFITVEDDIPDPLAGMSVREQLEYAREHIPDFKLAGAQYDRADVELKRLANGAKPQLDLVVSSWRRYLDDERIGSDAFSDDFSSWQVGLEFSTPLLGGQRQKKEVAIAQLEKQQAAFDLATLQRSTELNIQLKRETLDLLNRQLAISYRSVANQQLILADAQQLFLAGESETRRVLEEEMELVRQQRLNISRSIEVKLAQIELNGITGAITERYFPDFEQVLSRELPTRFDFNSYSL